MPSRDMSVAVSSFLFAPEGVGRTVSTTSRAGEARQLCAATSQDNLGLLHLAVFLCLIIIETGIANALPIYLSPEHAAKAHPIIARASIEDGRNCYTSLSANKGRKVTLQRTMRVAMDMFYHVLKEHVIYYQGDVRKF